MSNASFLPSTCEENTQMNAAQPPEDNGFHPVSRYPVAMQGPYEAHAKMAEHCIKRFLKYRAFAGTRGHNEAFAIAEMMLQLVTVRYDLFVVGVDNECAHRNYQRNLYSRVTATLLVEAFDDLPSQWGKSIRPLFESHASPELEAKAKQTIRDFNLYREQHHQALNVVRCSTLAHRTRNVDELIRAMHGLDVETIMDLNADVIGTLDKLSIILTELLDQTPAWHFWHDPTWREEPDPI